MNARIQLALLVTVMMSLLGGCSSGYTLNGKVIAGPYTDLEIVSAGDPRFNEAGIGEVKIRIHRDPDRLNQELITTGRSHSDGTFAVPISAFGAGWMDEVWLIEVERNGYSSGSMILRLPTGDQRLLVTMNKGQSTSFEDREDLWKQYEQYK